jgi:hypothetical protein
MNREQIRHQTLMMRAREVKLENAINAGRTYGLRKDRYDLVLRRALTADWRRPPVDKDWDKGNGSVR